MLPFQCEVLPGQRATRYVLGETHQPWTFEDVLQRWATEPEFCREFSSLLASSEYEAFRWETPGLSSASRQRPFEFVLVNDPRLQRTPEPLAFSSCFQGAQTNAVVAVVPNLGRTSELIVPREIAGPEAYVHLAAFLRGAPESQQDALWRLTAETASNKRGGRTCWLSTAGAGIAWLHLRLDPAPKYYWHRPYTQAG